jgi:Zn-dependent M28 family amino/carboxypeptidase
MEVLSMKSCKTWIALAVLTLALPATLAAQKTGGTAVNPAAAALEKINRGSLEAPIRFLADDLLEGRGPASRGDKLAQLYLSSSLESLGFEPGFGDSYVQPFDIVGLAATPPDTWTFQKGGQSVSFKKVDQFIASSGVQRDTAKLDNAEVVFVGYGIQAPEYQWDDFKGMNLKGKVVLMLNNDPDWDPKLFEGNRRLYYGRWVYKYESAARQGAAAAIIIHTTPSAGYGWQVVQNSWSGEQFELPAEGEPRVEVKSWLTEDAARQLVKLAGMDLDQLVKSAHSRDFKPVPLGVTTSLTLPIKVSKVQTANIGGLLRGSDPELSKQVVVYSAHHDHFGIGKPDPDGDNIYNGAVDNASGCAEIMAIGKAFASMTQHPRRSVLILFVAAEEQGLLGSQYYSRHPSFPAGRIAANINYDSGNIWGRAEDLTFIGLGKSSLDALVQRLAKGQDRTVVGDQFPDKGFFYRSDQFNFARIGVPAIYLDKGTHFRGKPAEWGKEQLEKWESTHYHQPSDELTPDWNFDGMVEDAQLGFEAGLDIANADEMPAWNPGDEFEAARKKAIAAVPSGK